MLRRLPGAFSSEFMPSPTGVWQIVPQLWSWTGRLKALFVCRGCHERGLRGTECIQTGRGHVDAAVTEGGMVALQCRVPTGWEMPPVPDHSLPSVREIAFLSAPSETWKCVNTCCKSKDRCWGRAVLGSEAVVLSILSGCGTILSTESLPVLSQPPHQDCQLESPHPSSDP